MKATARRRNARHATIRKRILSCSVKTGKTCL
jgi:hypothetical protein